MTMHDRVPAGFVELLLKHRRALGCDWKDIAIRAGLQPSQISAWTKRRDRAVSRQAVSRLAWSIAALYEDRAADRAKDLQRRRAKRGGPAADGHQLDRLNEDSADFDYRGVGDLEHILNALLVSVGFVAGIPGKDLVWHRVAGERERRLRVAWYPSFPFVYRDPDTRELRGISKIVTENVAALTGWLIDWVEISVAEVTPALLTGNVDMICCQYINISPRKFDVWVSAPLPRLRLHPAAVVSRECFDELMVEGAARGARVFRPDRAQFVHTRTMIGQSLWTFFIQAFGKTIPSVGDPEDRPGSLADLCGYILKAPRSKAGLPRVFVTDSLTAEEAQDIHGGKLARIPAEGSDMPFFEVGFALHPREEKLGQLLNAAIEKLREFDFFSRVAYRPWLGFLRRCDALPSAPRSILRENLSDLRQAIIADFGDPNDA